MNEEAGTKTTLESSACLEGDRLAGGVSDGDEELEALHRLERGEDPDRIEEEMGDLLEGEEPFLIGGKGKRGSRKQKPRVDETLYDL